MIFTPSTWQDSENDANSLTDNLVDAVRQLNIEQRVITALRDREETIRDPTGTTEDGSLVERREGGIGGTEEEVEAASEDELLETIEEQSEERIDAADNADDDAAAEDASEVVDCCDCECETGDDE